MKGIEPAYAAIDHLAAAAQALLQISDKLKSQPRVGRLADELDRIHLQAIALKGYVAVANVIDELRGSIVPLLSASGK